MPPEDELSRTLAHLHELFEGEENIDVTLQRVVELAATAIAGCDGAGITLLVDHRKKTSAATNDLVLEVDAVQYELDEGPCLSSIADGVMHRIDSMRDATEWTTFASRAADKGVMSALSFPLWNKKATMGSLNMYALRTNAFTEDDERIGSLFATQAAIAVHNSQVYGKSLALTRQLEQALTSRTIIAQAVGILMERLSCSSEDAFEAIRTISQKENRKVREIAEEIATTQAVPRPTA